MAGELETFVQSLDLETKIEIMKNNEEQARRLGTVDECALRAQTNAFLKSIKQNGDANIILWMDQLAGEVHRQFAHAHLNALGVDRSGWKV